MRDATGAAALFRRLGFEEVTAPLLDDRATGKAIQSLVTDDLMALGPDDSLVLFYAGHGGTRKHRLGDEVIKTGYLIPVDALESPGKVSTWVELEGWLRAVSLLPAKHILVILDACHSGIALDPIIKWRDVSSWQDVPLPTLQARRSRRIITSALDDQIALDSGPVHGHSLFTGCLIEGLTEGIARGGNRMTTGSELGLYVQRRVQTYPNSQQTPDFGAFAFDGRGEIVIPLVIERSDFAAGLGMVSQNGRDATTGPSSDTEPMVAMESEEPKGLRDEHALESRSDTEPTVCVPVAPTPGSLVVVNPTLIPSLPTHVSPQNNLTLIASRLDMWAWFVIGPVGVTFAVILIAYLVLGHESPQADLPINARPRGAVLNQLDAAPIDAALSPSAVVDGSFDTQLASRRLFDESREQGCPTGMMSIPEGTFQMGSPNELGDTDEHPQHEVTLAAYCIDETGVTVRAYAACVAAKGCSLAPFTVHWSEYSASEVKLYSRFCDRDDRPAHPINCVDWNQAVAYCKWADKRLPTEAEWEYAARGNDGRTYPWGNEAPSAKRLNACGSECVAMARRELNLDGKSMYDASDGWETTAQVGSFPEGASPFGVLDMAGNVWEWTADWYGDYPGAATTNPPGAKTGTARVTRGGGWHSVGAASVRAADRSWEDPSGRFDNVGFRCARDR